MLKKKLFEYSCSERTEADTETRFFPLKNTETGTDMKFLEPHSSSVKVAYKISKELVEEVGTYFFFQYLQFSLNIFQCSCHHQPYRNVHVSFPGQFSSPGSSAPDDVFGVVAFREGTTTFQTRSSRPGERSECEYFEQAFFSHLRAHKIISFFRLKVR